MPDVLKRCIIQLYAFFDGAKKETGKFLLLKPISDQ